MTKLDPAVIEALAKINPATLAVLATMTPEGLAEAQRIAESKARRRKTFDDIAKASDATLAAHKPAPLPKLADHGKRLAEVLPGDAPAFAQGGQAKHRELSPADAGLIEGKGSLIGAVRLPSDHERANGDIARAPYSGMELGFYAASEWSMAGQNWLFWYHPKLTAFELSDLHLCVLARFIRGHERIVTVAGFDMATEIEAYRRGQRATDPRKDAEIAELERKLAERRAA